MNSTSMGDLPPWNPNLSLQQHHLNVDLGRDDKINLAAETPALIEVKKHKRRSLDNYKVKAEALSQARKAVKAAEQRFKEGTRDKRHHSNLSNLSLKVTLTVGTRFCGKRLAKRSL
jgi:phage FluMu protein Com